MSGENVLPFIRKSATPLEDSLRIEDDKRLYRCTGAGSIFGFAFAAWALTVPISKIIPPPLIDPPKPPKPDVVFVVKPPENYHGNIHAPKVAKHTAPRGEAGHHGPKPTSPRPAEVTGTLGQNLITSRRGNATYQASDLIPKAMRNIDMDKLMEQGVLKRTPHSEDIGGRRGRVSHEFNVEYRPNGDGLPGDGPAMPGWERPEDPRGNPEIKGGKTPKVSVIDMIDANNTRSTADILAIIRSHSPGLRHVYNGFLKQNPGFAGKLNLRFAIAPSGEIVDLAVASSTTNVPDFDQAIVRQVKSWRFDAVKAAGNDLVTVPFTFSE